MVASTSDASFYIWFSSASSLLTLVSGVDYREVLPPASAKRFRLAYPPTGGGDVTIYGAQVGGGAPDPVSLFLLPWSSSAGVNSSGVPAPSAGNSCANMTLSAGAASVLTVTAPVEGDGSGVTDPCFCLVGPCAYIMSVACGNASASSGSGGCNVRLSGVIDTPDGPAIARLTDGVPVTGTLEHGGIALFSFNYRAWTGGQLRNMTLSGE